MHFDEPWQRTDGAMQVDAEVRTGDSVVGAAKTGSRKEKLNVKLKGCGTYRQDCRRGTNKKEHICVKVLVFTWFFHQVFSISITRFLHPHTQKKNHSLQTFICGRKQAAASANHRWIDTTKLDLKPYRSRPHPCHPGSLSPHRTGISSGCSDRRRHSDARSSWFVLGSPARQTGPDTAASRHTLEPQGCTSSHESTETHLRWSTNKPQDYFKETAL